MFADYEEQRNNLINSLHIEKQTLVANHQSTIENLKRQLNESQGDLERQLATLKRQHTMEVSSTEGSGPVNLKLFFDRCPNCGRR